MIQAFYRAAKPFLFRLDAEKAHHLGSRALKLAGSEKLKIREPLQRRVAGIDFAGPVGMAAGFDKYGEIFHSLPGFGFAFCELGTVTPEPQAGNEPPRLFRVPAEKALINRMGFNNTGFEAMAAAVEQAGFDKKYRLGLSLGKQKSTPLPDAHRDYLKMINSLKNRKAHEKISYLAVNISSPNTPGLRELQQKSFLDNLIGCCSEASELPLFVKMAPDFEGDDEFAATVNTAIDAGAAGLILTNTSADLNRLNGPLKQQWSGGLSGSPLKELALRRLQTAVAEAAGRVAVIASGGIMTAEDAISRLNAGADLVQLYTGFVYSGPALPQKINRLAAQL